ncbi:3-hydroxybenzoate 6-hydroxylase 1 [Triticum urartu]|uniref:3-hydroxybenzoate 6-hydroxylase 1 n=1 Tax=Triticum urartu TaxID=4572 RepID=M8A8B2_TRIUA|nr:3-hydroxybenzoate 6-hydroxylase 1 [Triticum urartu]
MEQQKQDAAEDVVIVGAGLAGVGVALGLHRKGVRSVVLESSPALRTSGFAFMTWTNAFRALDALGVGDKMRSHHLQVQGGPHEARCVQRNVLLQALEEELPAGTIRYNSRIVSIDDDKEKDGGGDAKILHLADGSTLRAKVLIGCDGINSVVARWLGLAKPLDSGRRATRGHAKYSDGHGFQPKFMQLSGNGFRAGLVPCGDTDVYWFLTWSPSCPDGKEDVDQSPAEMKQFVLAKLRSIMAPDEVLDAVERSEMNDVLVAPLRAQVVAASYMVGRVQQSEHAVVRFARDRLLSGVLAKGLLMMPDYDCGTL